MTQKEQLLPTAATIAQLLKSLQHLYPAT